MNKLRLLAHERAHAGLERRIEIDVAHERVETANAEQLPVEEPSDVLRARVGDQALRLVEDTAFGRGCRRRRVRSCWSGAEFAAQVDR